MFKSLALFNRWKPIKYYNKEVGLYEWAERDISLC